MKKLHLFVYVFALCLFSCDQKQNKVKNIDLSIYKTDYNFLILYRGNEVPKAEIIDYYKMEKLTLPLTLNCYRCDDVNIIEVPNKTELYLIYNLLANIQELHQGQYDVLLFAKNKKFDSLSYFLLYDNQVTKAYDGQNFIGVLNSNNQNFVVNSVSLIDGKFLDITEYLNTPLINSNVNDYLRSLKYTKELLESYQQCKSDCLVIDGV